MSSSSDSSSTNNFSNNASKNIETLSCEESNPGPVSLTVKHAGKKYTLEMTTQNTIADIKQQLTEKTNVLPIRQKLIGFYKGKLSEDTPLHRMEIKSRKFMMMGTPEKDIFQAAEERDPMALPAVVDDLAFDYFPDSEEVKHQMEARRKLQHRIQNIPVRTMHPPRNGKKLLVLDIDYTIYDCKSTATNIETLMRPYLHDLLTNVYQYYDIAFWSQTSWKWVEMKLTEFGILTSDSFRVMCALDQSSMFTVMSPHRDKKRVHGVKPLEYIWSKFTQFDKTNTVHVDDLSRNFAMNPENGIKIKAFRNAPETRDDDRELKWLKYYLLSIVEHEDLSRLDHRSWKKKIKKDVKHARKQ
eukprot:gb/GECH01008356.1/.p1 GENE.gb/GECH01008356.1/~~gb/GECH01008356.1/.p1  ORF type:complete len:356 (+),score=84.00 gb/GECH01008356.1/:1-1068(+)